MKTITVVKDFNSRPYGRYRTDCAISSGEAFRQEILVPALLQDINIIVDLTGYNRYTRSWLSEISEGLIIYENIKPEEVLKRITYKHNSLTSVPLICNELVKKHLY